MNLNIFSKFNLSFLAEVN